MLADLFRTPVLRLAIYPGLSSHFSILFYAKAGIGDFHKMTDCYKITLLLASLLAIANGKGNFSES